MNNLFTLSNYKTQKGEAEGWMTAILHLLPAESANLGIDVCPKSTPECRALCLVTAGLGVTPSVHKARWERTRQYMIDSEKFTMRLVDEIVHLQRVARRKGFSLCVRVNGTSDLPALARSVARRSPVEVTFYDYTKIVGAIPVDNRGWVHYTFSRSENNEADCVTALEKGANVAVVFSTKKGENLPKTYFLGGSELDVIDGDVNDLRFLDPRGVIVGLRAKGKARKHRGGFVVAV